MSDQLQAKILEYLNSSQAFVREQAPEYVNQALTYYAWDAMFQLKVSLAALVIGISLLIGAVGVWRKDTTEGIAIVCFVFGLGFTIFGSITTCLSYSQLKKIELAPKVFLLETLMPRACK